MIAKAVGNGYSKKNNFDSRESHRHDHHELYYLISGTRRYVIENEIYDIKAGDFILIPSMTMHRTMGIPGTPDEATHERFLMYIDASTLPKELEECFQTPFYRIDGENALRLKEIVEDSVKEELSKEKNFELIMMLNTFKILALLSKEKKHAYSAQNLGKHDRAMQSAACYIKENCQKPLTLKEVAHRFYFSREYFSAAFKASIGIGFSQYLTSMRLSKALTLLKETDLSVSRISEECGFNDSNYFTTVFKKNIGIVPLKYRKNYKS